MTLYVEDDFEWDESKFEQTARAVLATNSFYARSTETVESLVEDMKYMFLRDCCDTGVIPFFFGTGGWYITAGKSSFRTKYWVTATLMPTLGIEAAKERDALKTEVEELKAKLAKISKMAKGD